MRYSRRGYRTRSRFSSRGRRRTYSRRPMRSRGRRRYMQIGYRY